ncbi:TIGR04141 family sporadically distributed protein [Aeromonas hydrophila]|nr:TIGR04141 family sporadically distributed protein [Aeromonas hydrophila]
MKSRPFTIFLLKQGFNAANSLKEDHDLGQAVASDQLPENSSVFILDSPPREPWWREYFNITNPLRQVNKGALVFIPVMDRYFALSFGHVFHKLRDNCYEYDFGLLVTLNSLDPNKLKSADIIDPGASRRKRTQIPAAADITFLDFDSNTEIVRSLTGAVKEELIELFKSATGSASLKISLKLLPQELH